MHVLGALNLGSPAIVPGRRVLHVTDLGDDGTARLGPLLRDVVAAVAALTDPVRVSTCLWSTPAVNRRTATSSCSRSTAPTWPAVLGGSGRHRRS